MHIQIDRDVLLKALAHCQSVVEKKTTLPILTHVLLDVRDNNLILSATDLDLYIREILPVKVMDPGAITVPAQTLYDIARKLPEGAEISIESNENANQVLVKAKKSKFTLLGLKAADFPRMPEDNFSAAFALKNDDLQQLIHRSRFAMSHEEARYALNGIFVHIHQDSGAYIRCVATDGHRLARLETLAPNEASSMTKGVILPKKTVDTLARLLTDSEDPINISVSETMMLFTFKDMALCTKLVDGQFPAYQKLIPLQNDVTLKCDRKNIVMALDRTMIVASEKLDPVKLTMQTGKVELSLQGTSSESAVEECDAEFAGQNDDAFTIGFNPRYLLEILQQIEDETVEMRFKSSDYSVLIKGANDNQALYVLMPMMV